jgi:hypothetical protein
VAEAPLAAILGAAVSAAGIGLLSLRQMASGLYLICMSSLLLCLDAGCPHVQSLKDAIVVTAGGAEVLPFLAFFCVLPASLAFFVLYGKLVRACVSPRGGLPAEECGTHGLTALHTHRGPAVTAPACLCSRFPVACTTPPEPQQQLCCVGHALSCIGAASPDLVVCNAAACLLRPGGPPAGARSLLHERAAAAGVLRPVCDSAVPPGWQLAPNGPHEQPHGQLADRCVCAACGSMA